MKKNELNFNFINKILYIILPIITLYLIGLAFESIITITMPILYIFNILTPFFIAIVLAWLITPLVDYFETQGIKRGYGTLVSFIILFIFTTLFIRSIVPMLISQVSAFIDYIPTLSEELFELFRSFFENFEDSRFANNFKSFETSLEEQINLLFNTFAENLQVITSSIFDIVSGISSVIMTSIFTLTIAFYLIIDFKKFGLYASYLIPKKYRTQTIVITKEINVAVGSYVRSFTIISIIVFVLSSIGLTIIGVKASILFGLIIGITNIIPYIGPFIGGIPAVLIGFSQGIKTGILAFIIVLVVQQLDALVLKPIIMGKSTNLHPVVIIVGILLFGSLFGIVGVIIAIPLVSIIKILFFHLNKRFRIVEFE